MLHLVPDAIPDVRFLVRQYEDIEDAVGELVQSPGILEIQQEPPKDARGQSTVTSHLRVHPYGVSDKSERCGNISISVLRQCHMSETSPGDPSKLARGPTLW